MKLTIFLAFLFIAFFAKAQTIDTSFHSAQVAKISPVVVFFTDTVPCEHLGATPIITNSGYQVEYTLFDSLGNSRKREVLTITDTNYLGQGSDLSYLLGFNAYTCYLPLIEYCAAYLNDKAGKQVIQFK